MISPEVATASREVAGAQRARRRSWAGIAAVTTLALAGCAVNTGIVPTGQGNYMVARQAATGFPGLGTLKADALREADQFCVSQGKVLGTTSATENQGPFILGKYPRAEVQFTCVSN